MSQSSVPMSLEAKSSAPSESLPSRIKVRVYEARPLEAANVNGNDVYLCVDIGGVAWRTAVAQGGVWNEEYEFMIPASAIGEDLVFKLKTKGNKTVAKVHVPLASVPGPEAANYEGDLLPLIAKHSKGEVYCHVLCAFWTTDYAEVKRKKSLLHRAMSPSTRRRASGNATDGEASGGESADGIARASSISSPPTSPLVRARRAMTRNRTVTGTTIAGSPRSKSQSMEEMKVYTSLQTELDQLRGASHRLQGRMTSMETALNTVAKGPEQKALGKSEVVMDHSYLKCQPAPLTAMGVTPSNATKLLSPGFDVPVIACCDNHGGPETCVASLCCPCILNANTAAMLDNRDCSVCDACCLTAYGTRQRLRAKYDLGRSPWMDALMVFFCHCCVVSQTHREAVVQSKAENYVPTPQQTKTLFQ